MVKGPLYIWVMREASWRGWLATLWPQWSSLVVGKLGNGVPAQKALKMRGLNRTFVTSG
jgi:hypothetical protein